MLVIYSFNDSQLVTVWGGFSTNGTCALLHNEALIDAAWVTIRVGAPLRDGRDRARHAGGDRARALRALPRAHAVLRHGLRAARHARGDHRPVAAAALRRDRLRPRLLDGDARPHHLLHVLRRRRRAVAARRPSTVRSRRRRSISAPAGRRPSSRSRCRSSRRRWSPAGCSPSRCRSTTSSSRASPPGPGATTLPMKIYSQVRLGVTPEINAVCTILIAVVDDRRDRRLDRHQAPRGRARPRRAGGAQRRVSVGGEDKFGRYPIGVSLLANVHRGR